MTNIILIPRDDNKFEILIDGKFVGVARSTQDGRFFRGNIKIKLKKVI